MKDKSALDGRLEHAAAEMRRSAKVFREQPRDRAHTAAYVEYVARGNDKIAQALEDARAELAALRQRVADLDAVQVNLKQHGLWPNAAHVGDVVGDLCRRVADLEAALTEIARGAPDERPTRGDYTGNADDDYDSGYELGKWGAAETARAALRRATT